MEHLTQKQVEDYVQQQLPAVELLAVSDHLGDCDLCRTRVEWALNGDAAFLALHEDAFSEDGNASAHLTTEQTADYVDKKVSGEVLQIANDHLTACEQCKLAVEDLRVFRNQIAPSLDREYGPTSAPAVVRSGWREKLASIFKVGPVPAFGTAALAVLLLVTIGWFVWRAPSKKEEEVVVAPTPITQPSPVTEPSSQPTPAALVAELNDAGGVLSLDQEGKLSGADNLPPAYQGLLRKALTSQSIERSPQLQGLTRPRSSLMGGNNKQGELYVLEPVGDVLLTNQPTFSWTAMEGPTSYVVEVYDDQFQLVASSLNITDSSWTSPVRLTRGKVYSWQVKASKEGQEITSPRPPAPQAKFRILDQAKASEIAKAKRAYASSHLTLALLYAEVGLLREAEQELRLLRRANPDSELVRNLLRQVQNLRQE